MAVLQVVLFVNAVVGGVPPHVAVCGDNVFIAFNPVFQPKPYKLHDPVLVIKGVPPCVFKNRSYLE